MEPDKQNSSNVGKVTALHGGEVNGLKPNEGAIEEARKLLEMAESGEVTGFVVAKLHSDNLASYTIAGMAGPYSVLGALDMAKSDLIDLMKDQYE